MLKRFVTNLKRPLPLHVHITLMFVALVIVICGVQIWITQASLNKVLLNANENLFERITSEARTDLNYQFSPVFTTVDTYSSTALVRENDAQARFSFAPELISQLHTNRFLTLFVVGYPNGDWFTVVRITNERLRHLMQLSPSAEFAALSFDAKSNLIERRAYNAQQVHLSSVTIPYNNIDIRRSVWYRNAATTKTQVSEPYFMPIIGQSGISIFRRATNGAVFGADLTLSQVSKVLQDATEARNALRLLYDDEGHVYGFSQPELFDVRDAIRSTSTLTVDDIVHPLINKTLRHRKFGEPAREVQYRGERWVVKVDRFEGTDQQNFNLAMAVKADQLLKDANSVARYSLVGSFIALLFALPCIYYMSQWLAKPIRQASEKAKSIQHFRFNDGSQNTSQVAEIKEMSDSFSAMQSTIRRFLSLTNSMAKEYDLDRLLALVCSETAEATHANSTYIYLLNNEETLLELRFIKLKNHDDIELAAVPPLRLNDPLLQGDLEQFFRQKKSVYVPHDEVSKLVKRDSETDSVLFIPLIDRQQKVIGALGLGFDKAHEDFVLMENLEYIETLAAYASVTIETQAMLASQKALLDSFIQVMAEAIDTKSPYTGNHCQRVPVLTEMLTLAAQQQEKGPFEAFSMTKEQWEELHVAAWLHDCGKVTTPEHVIDKATKLETIYNRIHEVRMRFEILKRDAELSMYKHYSTINLTSEQWQELEAKKQQIDDDFAIIAKANTGDEYLTTEALERINAIAKQTWTATIDSRLGLSWEELSRYDTSVSIVGNKESILSDGVQHLVAWEKDPEREPRFVIKPGEHQNNLGELYNLSVRKGTLNEEERYIINSHMIATLRMLERLPFPKHMTNVPLLAGSHHERIDGKGYPLGLVASELPVAARAMAIADVFEALTSQDRPYKQPKKLSETLAIMRIMVNDGHLDGALFELFLTSNVYLDYAQVHIKLEQIDVKDVQPYLSTKKV
ncbi:hypothetical protein BCU70_10030 [Vibrio sp. 10N.286.49.C2]|uniref:HD domain-containing phosphohydrolase n=1 Tax=unclassified Vibrio TaxID=2614977 RepID=UPI000C84AEB2|nr:MULTISPECIES: HD domain-containing phosphohydrolase [unclassified Vibrio]PMH26476.1 hypothetical protein BCU70_10030 [Vibrio sp. 10N.286.49.C2]PMH54800.1 hypothetical protein BCU66_10905 [Vibrio sp. 10N.286.49.B1]PMH83976.1 hypothetical protein BCU58_12805 [Vibrio sp. 10N.286.48.B7]